MQKFAVNPARHHPITFSINGKGYIFAGVADEFDMWRFDPLTKKTVKFDVPENAEKPPWRTYAYGVAIGDTAYLGFGLSDGVPLSDWWKYEPDENKFTQLASLPSFGRWHPAMVSYKANRGAGDEWFILISCGSSQAKGNLKETWEYSVRQDKWTQRDDIPAPPRHHPYYFDAITAEGKHYAYVGFGHAYGSDGYIKKDLHRFDPETLKWDTMKDFPGEKRVAGTQFSYSFGIERRGYVLSGDGDNHGYMATGELWEYNPNRDTWRKLKPHPGNSRWAPGSFVIDCNVYLIAGYDRKTGAKNRDIYKYNIGFGCTNAPTSFPTRKPSKSPTSYPTYKPCAKFKQKVGCNNKRNRKTCAWDGDACVERVPTPFPTFKPCSQIAKRVWCNNKRNRKTCVWSEGECVER